MKHRRPHLALVLLGAVVLVGGAPLQASAQCATGTATWRSRGTNEYYLCTNELDWPSARAACNAYAASDATPYYLVRPNDAGENGAIDGWISTDIWIGANDRTMERGSTRTGWVFSAGLSDTGGGNATYTNWIDGFLGIGDQPDNDTDPCGSQGEDCVEMRANGEWNDDRCFCNSAGNNVLNDYMCEGAARCGNGVHASTEACDQGNLVNGDGCSSTCQIEPGWTCTTAEPSVCTRVCTPVAALGSSTYCASGTVATPTSANWTNAQAACVTVGGNLVKIDNAAERYHLTPHIAADTWVGGERLAGNANWRWRDTTAFWNLTTGQLAYNHWVSTEPNIALATRACLEMNPTGSAWRWSDETCTVTQRYMCELPNTCGDGFRGPSEQCDDGNIVGGDGCSANCLTATSVCGDGRIYGSETCDDGNMGSGDGCSYPACQLETGWVCPGPTVGGACTAACGGGTPLFFSRFPMTDMQLGDENTAQPAHGPSGQSIAERTEYLSCTANVNAYEAQRRCASYGWNLVRMNSTFENVTLPGNVLPGATFWIGATDEATEGLANFLWRDGTSAAAPNYTSWTTPPSDTNGEDCTTSNGTGVWNDLGCHVSVGFVCEGAGFCGNGAVSHPEACDKGPTGGTGCTASCTIPAGYGCLLPGGNSDPADGPGFVATCGRASTGSCCFLAAQAVIGDVRVVGGELEWTTLSEAGTTGFQVSALRRGEWVDLHEGVLPALPDAAQGAVYRLRASLRGATIRIVEHEAGAPGLTVYEGSPRVTGGAATLTLSDFSVTANRVTGPADLAEDAEPSPAARRKAAGDAAVGVFALAAEEGLTRVTFAEIAQALAVPVQAVADRVADGELSITTYGTPVAWTQVGSEDAIAFTARRRTSVYSGTRPYELRLGAGVEFTAVDRALADVATGVGTQRVVHEVDVFPALAVSADPTNEFWFQASLGNHSSFSVYTSTVELNDVDGEAASFDLAYYGAPGLSAETPLTLTMTVNGEAAGTHDVTTTGLGVVTFALPAGALEPGPNAIRITAASSAPAGTALVYVDRYTVTYGALLEFEGAGRFQATENGALAFELAASAGGATLLVDATLDRVIMATRTDIDGTRARFTFDAQAGHEYFVASESGLHEPSALRARSEQHFADSSRAGEYVVIAPAALYDAATALAARRQTQGLTTAVVDVQDIYDAFGHGDHSPYAIREFLRVAHTNWSAAPRYVLLLGDGNYDYRGVRATGSGAIPPMLIRTERGVYSSDMSLGDVDADGRADIAIGRVPAHTALEADAFVQRVVTYESGDLDAFTRDALLVSGTNRGEDFTRYVDTLASQLDTRVNAERIDRAALSLTDARTQLIGAINDGSFWFHYQGHGASGQLDDDGLLTLADVAGLTNTNALTIFTGMSCSTSRFEVPGMDSISELMLNGSPGGAIALYGPSGPGYTFESGNIADAFQRHLLTGNHLAAGRMGDVVLGLWQQQGGANASSEQLAIYLLLGDPATVLPDRSRLAPPPVVVDPPVDGGVVVPGMDAGVVVPGIDAGDRADAGRPTDPVIPRGGALGGGACSVGVGSSANNAGGLLLLLSLFAGLGRRARRRTR